MAQKRVLLLGVTGVDKAAVTEQFASCCAKKDNPVSVKAIDFEHQFLRQQREGDLSQFLDDPPVQQFRDWRAAWESFEQTYGPDPNCDAGKMEWGEMVQWGADIVLLSLHASFIRGHYGVRIGLDLALVRRFKPNVVVTLVDDVYDMWWRTEERASGEAWRGRPTLEQLLTARRVEQAVGTQIAHLTKPPVPHYLLSVHHSCETLFRLVCRKPLIVYLSFPISRPRELEQGGDQSGIEEINEFLVAVYARQAPDNDLVFLNPLTIDERPLIDRALPDTANRTVAKDRDGQHEYEGLLFDRERYRWALPDVCNENALSPAPPEPQERVPLDVEQVKQAAGLIKTDVGWRDYSLVAQANRLAAFNPVFRNADAIARGVRGEIETQLMIPQPAFCYQSAGHDPNGKFKTWVGDPGSTGLSGLKQRLIMCSSVEELLDRVTRR